MSGLVGLFVGSTHWLEEDGRQRQKYNERLLTQAWREGDNACFLVCPSQSCRLTLQLPT